MHRNWQDLIKPSGIEVNELSDTYGKFVIKPLERGYGVTLGNSLRRVLLASINGAAIVAVRIDGIEHEFSTIQGVKEDVTDIILNLKQVNLRYFGESDTTITLSASGQGVLRAGDIQTNGDVEILNPEQLIATLGPDAKLNMEMIVRHGRGYVSAEQNRPSDEDGAGFAVGTIAIDAIFAPVRRVAYNITNARVGQMTDYDRLSLEIWTNGAVRPDDAVAFAAKILKEQLTVFINFDETEEEDTKVREVESSPRLNENLFKTVDSLELSVRAANCLENADIKYIGELVVRTESDMLKTKNFGRKSLNEIKDILSEMGLSLGMKIDNFDPSTLRKQGETSGH
ncbi:MAG: DNA-directed RNA polymerase subunit alpha [Oligoflexales bacterium]|nr:DNA-directed RNA polymerase subunit alpha [Oligoflexales bacterium]